jgi:O-Antigen ligase/PDZ domain
LDHIDPKPLAKIGQRVALTGLFLFVVSVPHSVAASAIAVGLAGFGWLLRTLSTHNLGLRRTNFDLIILLSLLWTVVSALLSFEPAISVAKLQASWSVFIFYLTRSVLTRRSALMLVIMLIVSGSAGALYSTYDLLRGRGVVVESLTMNSSFRQLDVRPGDTIWRVGGRRVYSESDLDEAIKSLAPDTPVSVSVISNGEHVELPGFSVPATVQTQGRPSGVAGSGRSHRFRASGWTRHYETFAEILQMIGQLALGLALAHLRNHGVNRYFKFALPAVFLITIGIALTAMRTVLLAFVAGAFFIAWRSTRGVAKLAVTFALFFVLAFGAVVIWQTRAQSALLLGDDSASLRSQVARVGLSRILIHPVFGHGMDAMQKHWTEWGFPGKDMLHLHSTPLQLAFDRGLPMLALWLLMMILFWIHVVRAGTRAADMSDTNTYGILLGASGAVTGFLLSSIVNYNYGDSEVAMLFWWLMGVALVLSSSPKLPDPQT